jgi:hypothetical protein
MFDAGRGRQESKAKNWEEKLKRKRNKSVSLDSRCNSIYNAKWRVDVYKAV